MSKIMCTSTDPVGRKISHGKKNASYTHNVYKCTIVVGWKNYHTQETCTLYMYAAAVVMCIRCCSDHMWCCLLKHRRVRIFAFSNMLHATCIHVQCAYTCTCIQ